MRRKLIASATPPLIKKEKIEKMRINKKLYTTSIIAILTISMVLMAFPLASAVTAPTFSTGVADVQVGQKVTVTATSTPGAQVEVYWESQKAWDGAQGLLGAAYSTGTAFSLQITIPAAAAGAHDVILKDLGDASVSSAAITVAPKLVISPTVGLAGDVITVTGTGYNDLEAITMTYWNGAADVTLTTSPLVPQSSALGSFTCTFVVPATAVTAAGNIIATDVTGGTAAAQLTVGPYIVLTPTKGLKASTVQVAGRGFTPNKLVDIRWYLDTPPTTYVTVLAATPADAAGAFTVTITVPLLPDALAPGTPYTIRAIDNNTPTPVQADATFTLIQTNAITVTPAAGKVSSTVTVTGTWFSGNSLVTVTFDDTEVAVITSSGTGSFSTTFTVPADAALGAHTITATDAKAVTASKTYVVVVDSFMVETRATEYVRMDVISIKSSATIKTDCVLRITDPAGSLFFTVNINNAADWQTLVGGLNQISYTAIYAGQQLAIPSDAPLGSWNFTCYNAGMTAILDTNLFTVAAKATQQDVLDALNDLEDNIQSIVTTSEGKIIAVVNTKTGTIMTDLSALDPKLQGIEDTVVIIATMLGEVQVDISALNFGTMGVDITAIKGDVATIKTNIGTVDTKVSNLDPVIGAIAGQNAEVQTKLGTLEGKITSIEGNTATIETSVGTLQADITDVKAEVGVDMTPVWIAVVLSLVAAIAAIFAVITIRQKIAG